MFEPVDSLLVRLGGEAVEDYHRLKNATSGAREPAMEGRMRLMVLVSALAMIAMPAMAGDWRVYSLGDTAGSIIDVTSIRVNGERRFAWLAHLSREEMEEQTAYIMLRREFDCTNETSAWRTSLSYDRNGEVTATENNSGPFEDIIPDTPSSSEWLVVCKEDWSGYEAYSDFLFDSALDAYTFLQSAWENQPEPARLW